MLNHMLSLRCLICGREFHPSEVQYVCPDHGYDGILDVQYDYDLIGRRLKRDQLANHPDPTIWRYRPLLPVSATAPTPPLVIGPTPLYDAPRLAQSLGIARVWVKDEGHLPTGSLKDRASAMALMKGQELGAEIITAASTGNAAAALAGLCASVGQPNIIFVPQTAPEGKIAQLLIYGATVFQIQGSYDDAFSLCLEAAAHFGWYNRNTGYNPYMTEGKKTVLYEIIEQLAWQPPDTIFVSVGDGCIIGGLHKGLKDLLALGWINRLPRLIGVQAEGSAFLAEAWRNNEDPLTKPAIKATTVADSINAGLPRDRLKAMAAVRETGGAFITVTDQEILAATPTLARGSGVFAEPAAAAAYAGLVKGVSQKLITSNEEVVVLCTGNGLKDSASALKAAALSGVEPVSIPPDLKQVRQVLEGSG